jgi:flagellar hook protein FlgE
MALNTALSGLLGAQSGINVAANNLANASTTGFKSGSALFADLYPNGSSNAPGQGVTQQFIQQDYAQGNLQTTGNPLDLAVQGAGMFVVQKNGQNSYTRDGALQVSPSGQLRNAAGSSVLGYGINANGLSDGILGSINISTSAQPANASSKISLNSALNSADPAISATFNPGNSATYDESTSVVAYDSLGNANHIQLYFQKQPASGSSKPNAWNVYAQPQNANGSSVGSAPKLTTLNFNSSGALTGGGSANLSVNWKNGAAASNIAFNLAGTTVGAQNFAINSVTNNGYQPGTYTGTKISNTGQVQATYSNGQNKTVGSLALASFINEQGLIPVSSNLFQASQTSGQPVLNSPGAGVNGTIVSGSLEESNTSTSSELVNLLRYQEAYQANTSVLQGSQQDTAKLLQLG